MAGSNRLRKIKTPDQIAAQVAREIDKGGLPEAQIAKGGLVVVSVQNTTEAQQRHMVRSGQKQTVRKLTRIEKLRKAGTIEIHEAAACEWYADQHALGFDTIGCTANYGGAGGGGFGSHDLLARYTAQLDARENYWFARAGIKPYLLDLFEAVVLEGKAIVDAGDDLYRQLSRSQRSSKLAAAFRLAANNLHGRIVHILPAE